MYVLARSKGQSIYLFDGKVKVTVVGVQGGIVRLGFISPPEVDILTEEQLLERYAELSGDSYEIPEKEGS